MSLDYSTISERLHRENEVYFFGNLKVERLVDEDYLAYLYLKLKLDGGLARLFYEGVPAPSWFIQHFRAIPTIGCFTDSGKVLVGLGYADPIAESTCATGRVIRRAELGMAFLRHTPDALSLGRIMMAWAFEVLALDVALGTTPAKNKAALLFRQDLGFRPIGITPLYCVYDGEPCDAALSSITVTQFSELMNRCVERVPVEV